MVIDYHTNCIICGKLFHVTESGSGGVCNVCRVRKNVDHLRRKKKRLDIATIKDLNRRAGQHWFSPDTMRFFKSKVPDDHVGLVKNRFFITSEKSPFDKRRYTIREWKGKTKSIETFGEFGQYGTKAQAKRILDKIMQGKYDEVLKWRGK